MIPFDRSEVRDGEPVFSGGAWRFLVGFGVYLICGALWHALRTPVHAVVTAVLN